MVERASRYETWLDEQVSTITTTPDGTTVLPSKVILEMEGEVWGTWSVSTPNLTEVVRQTVVRVGEELSKGQHPAKLIAIDSAGQTLAQHPLTIRGNSSAARQGTEQIEMQRAMTILVGNLESVSHSLTTQIDLLSRQNQELIGQNLAAISALQEVVAAKAESQIAMARQEARDARLAELVKQFAPALSAAAEILVARFASKIPGLIPADTAAAPPPAAPPPAAPPPAAPPPAAPPPHPDVDPLERQRPPPMGYVSQSELGLVQPTVEPCDLAAFDSQRSLGGSRKRRTKLPAPSPRKLPETLPKDPAARARLMLVGDQRKGKDRRSDTKRKR